MLQWQFFFSWSPEEACARIYGTNPFIESPEVAYLLGATRALAFHPPSRAAAAGPLARYLTGQALTL